MTEEVWANADAKPRVCSLACSNESCRQVSGTQGSFVSSFVFFTPEEASFKCVPVHRELHRAGRIYTKQRQGEKNEVTEQEVYSQADLPLNISHCGDSDCLLHCFKGQSLLSPNS